MPAFEGKMRNVLLFGAGKIGRMIAAFLSDVGDYDVLCVDADPGRLERASRHPRVTTMAVDVEKAEDVRRAFAGRDAAISALSFRNTPLVAEAAAKTGASYFDLTEDVATASRVRTLAASAAPGQVFMPQCGLAPGFVSILANHLVREFDRVDTVHMRVGALPQFPSNALRYNLTWSTDGLINEYCNPCDAILEGRRTAVLPLEGLEHFWLNGVQFEAFNTSGGIGTLAESLEGRLRELNYKTIRYPGHRDLMHFLIEDLRLGERRDLLKNVLEQAVPATFQDQVVVFCSASGWRRDQLVQINDARAIYSQTLFGEAWSAIQISTAASICAAVDLKFEGKLPERGFVVQEGIALEDFVANRFGAYYRPAARKEFGGME
jgi:saccharopine dehydrogenase-like NADP-dependent oxidoreductase